MSTEPVSPEKSDISDADMADALLSVANSSTYSSQFSDLERRILPKLQQILISVLGEPTSRSADDWRWGRKGSLSVDIGSKRGLWKDFENNTGGRIIDLIAREWGLNKDTQDGSELRCRLETLLQETPETKESPLADKSTTDNTKWTREEAIENFWDKGQKLSNAHGKAYLKNRGIDPGSIPFGSLLLCR